MKISASLNAYRREKDLHGLVRELDAHYTDMFHIDCKDNPEVFEHIRQIRSISQTPIDLHVISPHPEKFFPIIQELDIEYVSLQIEPLKEVPALPKGGKTKFGLSFSNSTPVEAFAPYSETFHFLMLMCTTPGESGGTFTRQSFQKINEAKHLFPRTKIQVDGGVNNTIAYILRLQGVDTIVSGSYLMNHESLAAGMLSFFQTPAQEADSFCLSDFAIPARYMPVLREEEVSFYKVLETIEQHRQGFVLIVNNHGQLKGVITNADVRRALLTSRSAPESIPAKLLINYHPLYIEETATVHRLLQLVNQHSSIVLFLPVVNQNGELTGTVLLNNLIRA